MFVIYTVCVYSGPFSREIFRVLDIMLLDMANAQIQQMRPYMKQQSILYERKKFEEFLVKQEGGETTPVCNDACISVYTV